MKEDAPRVQVYLDFPVPPFREREEFTGSNFDIRDLVSHRWVLRKLHSKNGELLLLKNGYDGEKEKRERWRILYKAGLA